MATTKQQLADAIEEAFDFEADEEVLVDQARSRIANKIANAIEAYVVTRQVAVTGVQPGSGAVTGLIQ